MSTPPVILMPAHNEARRLAITLQQWDAHCQDIPLFLVLDRCEDDSERVAKEAHARNPLLIIVHTHDNAHGKVGAVLQGAWKILASAYGYFDRPIILWDADAEYHLRSLPELLAAFVSIRAPLPGAAPCGANLEEAAPPPDISYPPEGGGSHHLDSAESLNAFMVVGRRDGDWLERSKWANRVVRAVLALKTGREPPRDVLSGSRILTLHDLLLATQFSTGFTLEMNIVRYMMQRASIIVESPVEYHPRIQGKHISAWDLPKIIMAGLR